MNRILYAAALTVGLAVIVSAAESVKLYIVRPEMIDARTDSANDLAKCKVFKRIDDPKAMNASIVLVDDADHADMIVEILGRDKGDSGALMPYSGRLVAGRAFHVVARLTAGSYSTILHGQDEDGITVGTWAGAAADICLQLQAFAKQNHTKLNTK